MPDQFIEDLPDGGDLQPTDLLYFQRRIAGTWNDFNIRAGAVNGVNVLVHKGVYTEADVVGPGNIQLFSVAVDKVAVFLPGTFVRYESPSPTGLFSVMTIGANNGQMLVTWNDTNVSENLCFTTTREETFAGDASVELSAHLAPGPFTLTVSVRYVLVTV